MPSAGISGLAQGLASGFQVGLQYRGQQRQLDQREEYLRLAQERERRLQERIDGEIEQAHLAAQADADMLRTQYRTPDGQAVANKLGGGSMEDLAAQQVQKTLSRMMDQNPEAFPGVARMAMSAMESMPLPAASKFIDRSVDMVSRMTNPEARAQYLNGINFHFGARAFQRELAQARQSIARRIDIGGYADVQIGPDGSVNMVTDPGVRQAFDQEFQNLMTLAEGATTPGDIDAARGALRMILQNEQQARATKAARNDDMMRTHQEVQTWGSIMEQNASNPEMANFARARMLDALHRSEGSFTQAAMDFGMQMPELSMGRPGSDADVGGSPVSDGPGPPPNFSDLDVDDAIRKKGGDPNFMAREEIDAAKSFGVDTAKMEEALEAKAGRAETQQARAKQTDAKVANLQRWLSQSVKHDMKGTSAADWAAALLATRGSKNRKIRDGRRQIIDAAKRLGHLQSNFAEHEVMNLHLVDPEEILSWFGFSSFRELRQALDGNGDG